MTQSNQQNQQRFEDLLSRLAPQLNELIEVSKALGMHDFDIRVGDGMENLYWHNGDVVEKSPTQDQLASEIEQVLDNSYPARNLTFMGMLWRQNRMVAEGIAKIVAEHRKRDRLHVGSQIVALLAAFKQGS